ncbi:DinB/UmuC family translesion DNA polymerase [Streptomyces sp. NPDC002755]|uniref:DinB/UmuC family translesion DNA polymerase n=1 Tax=Streptomyces sp. NPDC002884 TaxID=3154544 RepID=UPI003318CB96
MRGDPVASLGLVDGGPGVGVSAGGGVALACGRCVRRARAGTRHGSLVVRLGHLLSWRGQAARGLTLVLKFADGVSWEATRRLAEPSAHEDGLRVLAYRLMDAAGLQRGRLTALALKGEDLVDADQVAQQISLDDTREARLVAEAVIVRVRDRFGPVLSALGPSSAAPRESSTWSYLGRAARSAPLP